MNDTTKGWIHLGLYVAAWIGLRSFLIYQAQRNFNNAFRSHYYQRRQAHEQSNNNNMTWKKAAMALGVKLNKLKKMSKSEIKKVYRAKAKVVHPDKGGCADDFNKLNSAFQFAYAA